jgi:hypothetical protein
MKMIQINCRLVCSAFWMTALVACSSDTDQGASNNSSYCSSSCSKTAALMCSNEVPNSNCVMNCEAGLQQVPAQCKSQLDAYSSCASNVPFVCSVNGHAVADGCYAEGQAWVMCFMGMSDAGLSRP